jgi:hypothetical protein
MVISSKIGVNKEAMNKGGYTTLHALNLTLERPADNSDGVAKRSRATSAPGPSLTNRSTSAMSESGSEADVAAHDFGF